MDGKASARAAKLIRLLSSPNEGERLAAGRKLAALDLHALADRVEGKAGDAGNARMLDDLEDILEMATEDTVARMRNCAACHKTFVPRRRDAKTCGGRCRVRLHRQKASAAP